MTAWVNSCNCNKIIVCDDKAANDSLSKMLFEMAVPKSIELVLVSVVEGAKILNDVQSEGNALVLVGNLQSATELIELVPMLKSLNIGNISAKKERTQYFKSVFLTDEEIELARNLIAKGIDLYVQVVPTEKRYKFDEIVK